MKRRAVACFLLLFGLWPLVHVALTTHYGVDPWKLFGWAMYSVPGPMTTLRVAELRADGSARVLDYRAYEPDEQRVVDRFRERRRALGTLAPTGVLAADLLRLHPDWEGVRIAVAKLELDPESARLELRREREEHWRDGRDG